MPPQGWTIHACHCFGVARVSRLRLERRHHFAWPGYRYEMQTNSCYGFSISACAAAAPGPCGSSERYCLKCSLAPAASRLSSRTSPSTYASSGNRCSASSLMPRLGPSDADSSSPRRSRARRRETTVDRTGRLCSSHEKPPASRLSRLPALPHRHKAARIGLPP